MKKIVLSLAGVLAATAFAPEASAVPAFARQTGMACNACHAQHFPILNSFGRAFKAGGYTMMGSQTKVEGDHMSIPSALNASVIMKVRYREDNRLTAGPLAPNSMGDGRLEFFDEFALFLGGRVAENVGFVMEGQMNGTAPLAAGFKMSFVYDVGGAKVSVHPFTTDAMGPQMGYELGSGGVYRPVRWSESRATTSAVQYNQVGGTGGATGVAFAAQNDMGYIAYTAYNPVYQMGGGAAGQAANDLDSKYFRVALTPTVSDWAMQIGAGKMSGSSKVATATVANLTLAMADTDQTFFDFEAHGEVGGKELGVYLQHAKAPSSGYGNIYNNRALGAPDRKATTIGVDYSVIPHLLSIGAAYRSADTGAAATVNGDDAWTVQAIYDLYQNVALHAYYMSYSGSSRAGVNAQKNETLLMLEAGW